MGNNRYEYPEGYLLGKGAPRIFASDVRAELLNRVRIYKTENEMLDALGSL